MSIGKRFALFTGKLFILSILLWVFSHLMGRIFPSIGQPSYGLSIPLFFFLFTSSVHFCLLWVFKIRKQAFPLFFMGAMTLKLLCYGSFIFIIIYQLDGKATPEIILFLTVYLTFLVTEVWEAYHLVHQHWKDGDQSPKFKL